MWKHALLPAQRGFTVASYMKRFEPKTIVVPTRHASFLSDIFVRLAVKPPFKAKTSCPPARKACSPTAMSVGLVDEQLVDAPTFDVKTKQKVLRQKCAFKNGEYATMDDLPIPMGSWQEAYDKKNSFYNKLLISGLLALAAEFILTFMGVFSGVMFFNFTIPEYPRDDD